MDVEGRAEAEPEDEVSVSPSASASVRAFSGTLARKSARASGVAIFCARARSRSRTSPIAAWTRVDCAGRVERLGVAQQDEPLGLVGVAHGAQALDRLAPGGEDHAEVVLRRHRADAEPGVDGNDLAEHSARCSCDPGH